MNARLGGPVVLHGGVDEQQVPHASPEEVRAEVTRRIGDLSPGGGLK